MGCMHSVTPSTITAITASPRRAGRFVVEVDGRAFVTVDIDIIERFHLAVGGSILGVSGALQREAAGLETYDRALRMLASRSRSSHELRRQLIRKGEPAQHVDAAIVRLHSTGLLDDLAFARQFVQYRISGPGFAKRRLEQELLRRGVAREVVAEAIADVTSDDAVNASGALERVARKKMLTLAKLDPTTRSRRLFAFLARRGYDVDEIREIVGRLGRFADEDTLPRE
jgi:regulatory protein